MGQQSVVSPAEDKAMARAIELAARGLGTTSPNPVVGCVLLDASGVVVGEGFHAYAGGPHAEIVALAQAGERAKGGTAVVTLEPCNHVGRTGPCSEALIHAGVSRVVIAVADPSPVAMGGAQRLLEAGLDVVAGVRATEAEEGNIAWLTSVRRERPFVIWKSASTLDGRAAATDGSSMWITSEASRMDVHRLRGTVDAVMVGIGTILADDPRLTTRDLRTGSLAIRQPLRVVIDSDGRTPGEARVRDGAAPTLVATAAEYGEVAGRVDLGAVMTELHKRGVRSVLLEGGPKLAGAFLASGLVDRIVYYIAPKLLGDGPAALVGAGVTTITEAIELELMDVDRVGPDLRITARLRGAESK